MEAELAALAASGATALVSHMATDAWDQVKRAMAALFGRAGAGTSAAAENELDRSRGELTAALDEGDDGTVADIEAEWRLRLRRLLQGDPTLAGELRALLHEPSPDPTAPQVTVSNAIWDSTVRGHVVQGGVLSGNTFGDVSTRPEALD